MKKKRLQGEAPSKQTESSEVPSSRKKNKGSDEKKEQQQPPLRSPPTLPLRLRGNQFVRLLLLLFFQSTAVNVSLAGN